MVYYLRVTLKIRHAKLLLLCTKLLNTYVNNTCNKTNLKIKILFEPWIYQSILILTNTREVIKSYPALQELKTTSDPSPGLSRKNYLTEIIISKFGAELCMHIVNILFIFAKFKSWGLGHKNELGSIGPFLDFATFPRTY